MLTAEAQSIGQETPADATEPCKVIPCRHNMPWNACTHAYITQLLSDIYQQARFSQ